MNDYQKILEIIQNENNIKIANSYKKEVSFDVINSFNLKIKKEPNLIYDYLFVVQRDIENNFPIINRTFPPMLMRSFLYTIYFVIPFLILIFLLLSLFVEIEFKSLISSIASVYFSFFLAIFVYLYVTFNNKWKYLADLFNKIYYDNYKNDSPLEHLRKKLIFAQDIYDLNMTLNKSFKHDFYYTLTISAFIYDSLLKEKKIQVYRITEDKIEFLICPITLLEKVTSLIVKRIEINNFERDNSSSDKNLLSLSAEINLMKEKYSILENNFRELELNHNKIKLKIDEFLTDKQTKMNQSVGGKKKN